MSVEFLLIVILAGWVGVNEWRLRLKFTPLEFETSMIAVSALYKDG